MPPRAQVSSGSGSAFWAKFGFGFHRVFKFQQSSGSGLSGFTSEVRVLGFSGTQPNSIGHPVDDHVTLRIVNEQHLSKILEIQRQETGFSQQDSLKSVRSEVT